MTRSIYIFLFLLISFLSGFFIMALEILAFRIVQPWFGNSIYSTGAVIGVILTALTIGYLLGGSWSEKTNPVFIQMLSLSVAGIWVFLLAGIPSSIAGFFAGKTNPDELTSYLLYPPWRSIPEWITIMPLSHNIEVRLRLDPLLSSTALFFIPSAFWAMIGPCAIKALTRDRAETGKISGWVFSMGSLGSIAGVLLTSFWLIPLMGITAILRFIAFGAIVSAFIASLLKKANPHLAQ